MSEPLPAQVGPFRIQGVVGRGGMGIVLLGQDTRLDREVAIKALPLSPDVPPEERDALAREAKLLAALNHPHVATIHDLLEDAGLLYLVMELLEGESLRDRLARGALGLEESLRVGIQVASALHAAHELGIVHRDLKPANVRFTAQGAVKLLDFGIAQVLRGAADEAAADRVSGTPGYMSPEQAAGGLVDRRTDTWSLGCLLRECLTGRPPSGTPSDEEAALPDGTPASLTELLRRCLSKSPRGRPSDMADVVAALEEALRDARSEEQRPRPRRSKHGLPSRRTSLVGRERELEQLRELLSAHRLVTVTGVGGCGKTRLAVEAAESLLGSFPDGAWLVELAACTEPSLVASVAAQRFGLQEDAKRDAEQVLMDYLYDRELLLVLDNCEHLLGECARLADRVLEECPSVRILASSREGLAVSGEATLRLPSLAVPAADASPAPAQLEDCESVRLFLDRARAVQPGFELDEVAAPHVAEICGRLDGLPLALELAAAALPVLPVEAIASRLDDAFRLLTGGSRTALPRQRTLRATLEWSYRLLEEKERELFRRLSAFMGGWTLEAAEEVCSGDGIQPEEVLELLGALVRKSLVEVGHGVGGVRHRYLETVRQLAQEELARTPLGVAIREGHAKHFSQLAGRARDACRGPSPASWLYRLDEELANLRAALGWCLSEYGSAEAALRLAGALAHFWHARSQSREGAKWLERALRGGGTDAAAGLRASALRHSAALHRHIGKMDAAERLAKESLETARRAGDDRGTIEAMIELCMVFARRESGLARTIGEQALALALSLGDPHEVAQARSALAMAARAVRDDEGARAGWEAALAAFREQRHVIQMGGCLSNLAVVASDNGNPEKAAVLARQAVDIFGQIGHSTWQLNALLVLAGSARDRSRLSEAARHLAAGLEIVRSSCDSGHLALFLQRLAEVAFEQSQERAALALIEHALAAARRDSDLEDAAGCLHAQAGMLFQRGCHHLAWSALRDAVVAVQSSGRTMAQRPEYLEAFADLARAIQDEKLTASLVGALQEWCTTHPSDATARQALDGCPEVTDHAALAAGQDMTPDEAIALALRSPPPETDADLQVRLAPEPALSLDEAIALATEESSSPPEGDGSQGLDEPRERRPDDSQDSAVPERSPEAARRAP